MGFKQNVDSNLAITSPALPRHTNSAANKPPSEESRRRMSSSVPLAATSTLEKCAQSRKHSSTRRMRPKTTKESILGDLSRFSQDSYVCPFCGSHSVQYADQLKHINSEHPWYSLDVHRGTH
ncbi:hypothetical protein LPJ73_000391 [Coemansia sp. RSA 2703]|nr:hypothetical protein LPJ73_000391 [Coemansia sp. RSA 2703]KAJ2374245.1 hypothetical protein IW150_003209 [Coemansia sp. RSA 2607]KAJ2396895.1 hypothetical protein GGI05_000917 [Coemansia sp. RSA 2603]